MRHPVGPSRRLGLRAHLLALVLAVVVPALLFGVVAVTEVARSHGEASGARLQSTARTVALALDKEVEAYLTTLTALASSPFLDEPDLSAFDTQARQVAQALDTWIVALDESLHQIANTALPKGAPLPQAPSAGPAAQVFATGRPLVSDVFMSRTKRQPIVAVLVPVVRNEKTVKVLAMPLSPGSLARILHGLELSRGSFAVLIDSRRTIITHSRDGPRSSGQPAPAWYADPAASAESHGIVVGITPEGEKVALALQRLSYGNWTVAVAEPLDAYESSWQKPLVGLVLAGLVLLALAAAAALALARRVLRPVEALARHARSVTAGGSVETVPKATIAELETLRKALAEAEIALRDQAEVERTVARAVQDNEIRLRAVLEQMPLGVALVEAPSGRRLLCNAKAFEILGDPPSFANDGIEDVPVGAIHPDGTPYRREEHPIMRAILHGETVDREEMLHRRADGTITQLEISAAPIRDVSGGIVLAVGTFSSIDARKEAEEQHRLLTAELSHRVKNTLAVVQALMVQTLVRSRSLAEFRSVYEGRLHALARAHDLLLRSEWRHIDLVALVQNELALFTRNASRVEITGESVLLGPRQGLALGLVLHELVSNAVRHGALVGATGRIEITWTKEDGHLRLRWRELEGPPVPGSPAEGFGLELIRRSTSYDLGGKAECTFASEGVTWDMMFPL
ncbi:sensor histidine kinase [Benzoatithermus flavus]|uniref:histidine kinase n=1 Tax=Benzoatithermus flavus TaxID=3108223 RepID=A0ABU8XQV1_9PROT